MDRIELKVPEWLTSFLSTAPATFPVLEDRMRFVIQLARMNSERGTGGPFGAGVFNQQTHTLLAAGVNIVVTNHCSIAHAEIIAIMLAQQHIRHYDLSSDGHYELVTSTEPCAMCLGAIPWSGVKRVVYGSRDEDARGIGFDEGIKPLKWQESFASKQIEVIPDCCRAESQAVLQDYAAQGGILYNASWLCRTKLKF